MCRVHYNLYGHCLKTAYLKFYKHSEFVRHGLVCPHGSYKKVPQTGNVVIKDNVEIGSNCTIGLGTVVFKNLDQNISLINQQRLIKLKKNILKKSWYMSIIRFLKYLYHDIIKDLFKLLIIFLFKYFTLLVYPHPLSFDYSFNQFPFVGCGNLKALGSLLFYMVLGIYAYLRIKKKDTIAFGIL